MVSRKRELFVEGGGHPSLDSECRRAFSKLFEKASIAQKPRVYACGGRRRAYDQFCDALDENLADVWLLVDAEDLPARADAPWEHVAARTGDGWERPPRATDDHLHLMTVCMEAWLVADPAALEQVFGPKLDRTKLPAVGQLESTQKQEIYRALEAASKPTKASYGKGFHSFKTLEKVSPSALRRLRWAKRFLDAMEAQ